MGTELIDKHAKELKCWLLVYRVGRKNKITEEKEFQSSTTVVDHLIWWGAPWYIIVLIDWIDCGPRYVG